MKDSSKKNLAAKKAASKSSKNKAAKKAGSKTDSNIKGLEPINTIDDRAEVPRLIKANLAAVFTLVLLGLANSVLVWSLLSSKTEVIAVNSAGAIINPVPLPEAFVTDARVIGFVDECVRASFSHDFENYRRTVNAALPCYTSQGGKSFSSALEPLLSDIRARRLVMSITLEPPTIVNGPFLLYGAATWELQTVISLYFHGTTERFPSVRRVANVMVTRVPLEENYQGVAIEAIQLRPY